MFCCYTYNMFLNFKNQVENLIFKTKLREGYNTNNFPQYFTGIPTISYYRIQHFMPQRAKALYVIYDDGQFQPISLNR